MGNYLVDEAKDAFADMVDDAKDNPEFQKGMIAGQHLKECAVCMAKFQDFQNRILLGEIYEHAMEGQR